MKAATGYIETLIQLLNPVKICNNISEETIKSFNIRREQTE